MKKKEVKEITLSHSSANTLRGCEQKYVHYKVKGSEKDPDAENSQDNFNIGKAVHFILEELLHVWDEEKFYELLEQANAHFEVPQHEALIAGLAFKGMQIQKKEGTHTVHCEYKIQTKDTLGYVDIIVVDDDGKWWITDFKTSKKSEKFNNMTYAKLHDDYQLNLYASHAKQIAKDLNLDLKDFAGCRYRVVYKTMAKLRKNETIKEYIHRTCKPEGNIKGIEIRIDKDKMNPERILKSHKALWKRAKKLHEGAEPTCNYAHCTSFFRTCEYWSHCHGNSYTESLDDIDYTEY